MKACLQPLIHEISGLNTQDIEILIVDNSTNTASVQWISGLMQQFPFLDSLIQPIPGLSISRNMGAERAKGDFVFFLDDDCIPEKDMVRKILEYLPKDSDILWQATGQIVPVFKVPIPVWLNPEWLHTGSKQKKYLQGNLMGFSKAVFQNGFRFDVRLGMKGSIQNYGEETLLSNQLIKMGADVTYLTGVRAAHDFTNYTVFRKVWTKSYRVGCNWRVVHQKNRWQTVVSMKTNLGGIMRGVFPFLACGEAQNLKQRLAWSALNLSELFGKLKSIIRGI